MNIVLNSLCPNPLSMSDTMHYRTISSHLSFSPFSSLFFSAFQQIFLIHKQHSPRARLDLYIARPKRRNMCPPPDLFPTIFSPRPYDRTQQAMFSLGCSCGRHAESQTEESTRHGDCFSYVVSINGVHVCHPNNIVEYEDVGKEETENDSLALVVCEKSSSMDSVHDCHSHNIVEYEDVGKDESENDSLALVRCEKRAEAIAPKYVDPLPLLQRRAISLSRLRLAALLSSTESTVVNSCGDLVSKPGITNRPGPKNRKYEFITQIGADGEGVIDLVKERKAPQLMVRKTVGYAGR